MCLSDTTVSLSRKPGVPYRRVPGSITLGMWGKAARQAVCSASPALLPPGAVLCHLLSTWMSGAQEALPPWCSCDVAAILSHCFPLEPLSCLSLLFLHQSPVLFCTLNSLAVPQFPPWACCFQEMTSCSVEMEIFWRMKRAYLLPGKKSQVISFFGVVVLNCYDQF